MSARVKDHTCKCCGWETDVFYHDLTDSVRVRVRKKFKDDSGRWFTRGAIMLIPSRLILETSEGYEYPCIRADHEESVSLRILEMIEDDEI